jgi:alkylation response protein AidB-like acyl-CoA dehydrogenase
MDLRFSEEQEALRNSARKFLENEFDMESVFAMWEDEKGYTEDTWSRMADLGWLGLRIPEEYEGVGLSFVDLAVLVEEMGRVAMPGPFLSTVLATEAIIEAGSTGEKEALLPRIARGESKATLAISEPAFRYDAGGIGLRAVPEGEVYVLNGTKLFVLDGHVSDLIVLAARTREGLHPEEGITLFLLDKDVPGVSTQLHSTLDRGRKQCELVLENVRIPASKVLGEVDRGWPTLNRTVNKGAVALSMEMVGGGQKVLDISVEYAKVRVQFDQPIGSYQAIKHKCAQMMLEVEAARSIAYYAAYAIDVGGEEADIASSVAKTYCSEMYRNATVEAAQIFGAISLTWEHDIHVYLKRAKMNEYTFGDPAFHRERLAMELEY